MVIGPRSPAGTARSVLVEAGEPKFGVPSAFQVNRWARVERVSPQPWLLVALPW